MADNLDKNPDEIEINETYKDMMGTENPEPVVGYEEGKVELSIPRKVEPDPEPEEEVEPEPEPEPDAVPVYHEAYVDDEGIEHMVPPTYDKSGMKEEKSLFMRPNSETVVNDVKDDDDMIGDNTSDISDFLAEVDNVSIPPLDEIKNDGDVPLFDNELDEEEETPDFVRTWKQESNVQTLDDEVNAALDGDNDESELHEDDGFVLDEDFGDNDDALNLADEDEMMEEEGTAATGFIPKFELSPEEQIEAEKEDDVLEDKKPIEVRETLGDGDIVSQEEMVIDNPNDELEAEEAPVELPTVDAELPETEEQQENAIIDEIVKEEPSESTKMRNNADLFAREYSGYLGDQYFVVDSYSLQGEFVGNEECSAIQINASQLAYGWGVHFDNGWFMGIRDVREYQLRNGCLPSTSGEIMFGAKKMSFRNVSRIVLYEVPKYFTYISK